MFERFKWQGLNKIPISPYREYVYEVKISEGFDQKMLMEELNDKITQTDFSLYRLQKRFPSFNENQKNQNTFVIKSTQAEDKTYLVFDFKLFEGHAKPNDMTKLANILKSCAEIQSVNLVNESIVYNISDEKYKNLIIEQTRNITNELELMDFPMSTNKDRANEQIKDIAALFALEQSLPREGNVTKVGQVDKFTAEWVCNVLKMEQQLGFLKIGKEYRDKANNEVREQAEQDSQELTDYLNNFDVTK